MCSQWRMKWPPCFVHTFHPYEIVECKICMSLGFVTVAGGLWNNRAALEVRYKARKCYYVFTKDYTTNTEGVIN